MVRDIFCTVLIAAEPMRYVPRQQKSVIQRTKNIGNKKFF